VYVMCVHMYETHNWWANSVRLRR